MPRNRNLGAELREEMLALMAWLSLPITGWSLLSTIIWHVRGVPFLWLWPMYLAMPAATGALFFGPRLGWSARQRAAVLILSFLSTSLLAAILVGPRISVGAIVMGALLLAALFFGRRGLAVMIAVFVTLFSAGVLYMRLHGWDFPYAPGPTEAATWINPIITTGLVATFLGVPMLRLLGGYERNLRALGASEERLRSMGEATFEGLVMSTEGVVRDCNDQFAAMFGTHRDALIGRRLVELVAPGSRERVEACLASVTPSAYEAEALSGAGERIPVEIRATSLEVEGKPGRVSAVRDISAHKQTEAELQRLIAELTAKNVEMEQFAYTVSHDLKSPLVTIKGFLGAIDDSLRRGDAAAGRADLARIAAAADRMARLLDALLDMSRIGRIGNTQAQVSLDAVVAEASDMVGGRLKERGVTLTVAPGLPVVFGDRVRLVQVVQNALENAVKYMGDQPEPRITIGLRPDDARAVIEVRDNGVGIEPRHVDRVFRLFEKLDARSDGAGVGLALVKRIVEFHGGEVWIESAGSGRGTSLVFALPRTASMPA